MTLLIHINPTTQCLNLMDDQRVCKTYPVSTAKKGLGETFGSYKTPRGWHKVRAKIGQGSPINTVFIGRRPTGEVYSPALRLMHPERDWILTRILWLSGTQPGFNRFKDVDTMRRFIYIHGCPDEIPLDRPLSMGCIRMHNNDLMDLFNQTPVGTPVFIGETFESR